ncbi:hypothetical protein H8B13_18295 [Hymenobacter sp. BT188]|uniref:hypothetical protein n=1 Tax=Hymenobacter sp. BT188 TaxID=2763504 RepID=UPI0016519C75|nr:hypothetical protein [Hymenobacter sp. BT188]MBC6608785.1 hypothetical protein [Hymenobacter sp. BT188]
MSDSSKSKPRFGNKVLASITERIEPTPDAAPTPPAEEETVWVSFTTAVTRETYLKLKQAEYWEPAFLFKEVTEAALTKELQNYPNAEKPLPPAALEKLLRSSKKLR